MSRQIILEDYRKAIMLDQPFIPPRKELSPDEKGKILNRLLDFFHNERHDSAAVDAESSYTERRRMLSGLLTPRSPGNFPEEILDDLDYLMAEEAGKRKIFDPLAEISAEVGSLRPLLWQGDITRLKVGAIVNAANSGMLGCFIPFHTCIDNIIHDKAGPRLRQDCETFMNIQDEPEATGQAKITRGYHLPCKFILHTVGPVVSGKTPGERERKLLAGCYRSCLDLAAEFEEIRSVAFCCISTGVFGYPKEKAALVAISTVKDWLKHHPGRMDGIIFNVFASRDRDIYEKLLAEYDSI